MSELSLLERKLADIDEFVGEAERMDIRQRELQRKQPMFYDGMLHNAGLLQAVHCAYTQLETVLKDIVVLADGDLPASGNWHRDLLLLAATPVAGGRPALISEATHDALTALLGLRHVARGAYACKLSGEDVRRHGELAFRELPRAVAEVRAACRAFFGDDGETRI
jgi:hypothetical protein